MNANDLMQRIQLGEDSGLELKQLLWRGTGKINEPHPHSVADELAAFANAHGGMLVLGVDDRSRNIVGIDMAQLDAVEQWLVNLCRDLIEPELLFQTQHVRLTNAAGEAKAVIVVSVAKSLWVHSSPGGYMHRVGHEKRKMSTDYLMRLGQQRSQVRLIRFEEQPVAQATLSTLLARLTEPYLRPEQGDELTQLRRLHLLADDGQGTTVPSVAGALLCSAKPNQWVRGAYIQAVAYRGLDNDPAGQIDAKDFDGPITEQIEQAFQFAMRHMLVPATKVLGRVEYPQYSRRAVFEAIVNAVVHRDYSIHAARIRLFMFADRLTLCVPGILPNSMTIDAMTSMSLPRNDVLCSLLSRVVNPLEGTGRQYLMDKRGAGVEVILQESTALAGRAPEYRQIADMELQLTIYAAPSPHDAPQPLTAKP